MQIPKRPGGFHHDTHHHHAARGRNDSQLSQSCGGADEILRARTPHRNVVHARRHMDLHDRCMVGMQIGNQEPVRHEHMQRRQLRSLHQTGRDGEWELPDRMRVVLVRRRPGWRTPRLELLRRELRDQWARNMRSPTQRKSRHLRTPGKRGLCLSGWHGHRKRHEHDSQVQPVMEIAPDSTLGRDGRCCIPASSRGIRRKEK